MLKKMWLVCLVFCSFFQASSQAFMIDEIPSFDKDGNYEDYIPKFKEAIDFIYDQPYNDQNSSWHLANKFIMSWLKGNPLVSVQYDEYIVTFIDKNPYLLMVFINGWSKYSLETKAFDQVEANIYSIKYVIDFYDRNRAFLNKDKAIDKYKKRIEKSKLVSWIEDRVEEFNESIN